jgi:hypothetical protein
LTLKRVRLTSASTEDDNEGEKMRLKDEKELKEWRTGRGPEDVGSRLTMEDR